MKLINVAISPYIVKNREEMGLSPTRKALIIWDVLKGQVTDNVQNVLIHFILNLQQYQPI